MFSQTVPDADAFHINALDYPSPMVLSAQSDESYRIIRLLFSHLGWSSVVCILFAFTITLLNTLDSIFCFCVVRQVQEQHCSKHSETHMSPSTLAGNFR
ncbi:hypothetical protein BDR05DRAFT_160590 [Suillus weaverae]|nr:hypothetical protein BDR05DRAFT_160590 [Suillus weaverae]